MSLWLWVLAACAAVYATKLLGYLVPQGWLKHPGVGRVSAMLTIGLLAAAVALALRAPFILVVLIGAAAAAGIRALG